MVPPEEVGDDAGIRTRRNGSVVQESNLSQLIFVIPVLVALISAFTTLNPCDVIRTGTPGRSIDDAPNRHLSSGDEVIVEIDGNGSIHNIVVAESLPR